MIYNSIEMYKKRSTTLSPPPDSSLFNQTINSNTVYSFNKSLTQTAIEEKGRGNVMKKGSGGNSYASYMMAKKGKLEDFCDCK